MARSTWKSAASVQTLILGGKGFLGRHFRARYPDAATPSLDVANRRAVAKALEWYNPEVVINCAGKTGRPNVDWCEEHPLETIRANVTGALIVLEECRRRDIYLVHLSSGCLYEGDNGGQGFTEDDPPNFMGSLYARTKATAEQMMREFPVLTLRLRMPFDGSPNERNLILKLLRYRRVLNEPNSLTCIPDFLTVADQLIASRSTGVWNIVNEGALSPFQIMLRYRELIDPGHRFEPLAASQLGEVARAARSNCLLSTAKLRAQGLELPPVEIAVEQSLRQLARTRSKRQGDSLAKPALSVIST